MSPRLLALLAITALFAALSAVAIWDVGYFGLVTPLLRSWGGAQVLADLTIACTLTAFWMVDDGRTRGLNAWPFVALTVAAGSFGVLAYLLARELRASAAKPVPARA